VGCIHQSLIVKGRHPKDLPDFRWINIVISNFKTSFSGSLHVLCFEKYADRYLCAFCYRFNRHFNLLEMMGRILRATCNCNARPEHLLMSESLLPNQGHLEKSTRHLIPA